MRLEELEKQKGGYDKGNIKRRKKLGYLDNIYSNKCNHCGVTITTKDPDFFIGKLKEGVHLSYAAEHVSDSDRIEETHYNYNAGWECPVCGFDQNQK